MITPHVLHISIIPYCLVPKSFNYGFRANEQKLQVFIMLQTPTFCLPTNVLKALRKHFRSLNGPSNLDFFGTYLARCKSGHSLCGSLGLISLEKLCPEAVGRQWDFQQGTYPTHLLYGKLHWLPVEYQIRF